jgi:hypothetical protein
MALTDAQLVAAIAGVLHLTQFMPTKKYYTIDRALVAAGELVVRAPKALAEAREAFGDVDRDAGSHREKAIDTFQQIYSHVAGKGDPRHLTPDLLAGMEVIVDHIIAAAREKE